jgi:thioredoxin reductase
MERVLSATMKQQQPKVAIIGAGAAGLCTARVLSRELGLKPTVLEARKNGGGVWEYMKDSKNNPMYRGLRTNLPKEVMQYREKPWNNLDYSFVTHADVAQYLSSYEADFDLKQFIKFSSPVKQLTVLNSADATGLSSFSPESEAWPRVRLDYGDETDVFDAVFVCNGHYAESSSPEIPGLPQYYKGNVMHSVAYDDPSEFSGQKVLCVGGRASGSDLAREISFHADHVYLSDTTCELNDNGQPRTTGKVTWVPKTLRVLEDGSIEFDQECIVKAKIDTIIFCSGYDYSFPFINSGSNLDLTCVPDERRVMRKNTRTVGYLFHNSLHVSQFRSVPPPNTLQRCTNSYGMPIIRIFVSLAYRIQSYHFLCSSSKQKQQYRN